MTLSSILILLSLSFSTKLLNNPHVYPIITLTFMFVLQGCQNHLLFQSFSPLKVLLRQSWLVTKTGLGQLLQQISSMYVSLKRGDNHDKSFGDDICNQRQSCLCELKLWQSNNHDSHVDDDMCKENNIAHLRQSCRLPLRARRLGHKLQFSVRLINFWTG